MAEGSLARDALADRRISWNWNAPDIVARKIESERFEAWVMMTIAYVFGRQVAKSDRLTDMDMSADYRLLEMLLDLVGVKMIGHLIAQQWPNHFRCRYQPGVPNEWTHWLTGYPHWMFIGHKAPHGIVGWYIMDMSVVRMCLPETSPRFVLRSTQADTTSQYMSFNVTHFPPEAVIAAGGTMRHLA